MAQSGPASGQEFVLEGDELVVGRAADNAVSIPDTSVSRKHALVRKTAEGWAVSDLGSGNGTLLNGEAVADETALNDGDVITLGDTELRFSGPGASPGAEAAVVAPAPRRPPVRTARAGGDNERSSPRGRPVRTSRRGEESGQGGKRGRKLLVAFGGVLVLVLALVIGWKAIDNKRRVTQQQEALAVQEHQGSMAELFKDAKSLVRAGKWAEAKARLEEIQSTDPEYESRQVENYLKIAATEIPNQALLEEANEAITRGALAKASAALAKVKTTTQEEKLRLAREALDAKAGEKLGEARALMAFAADLSKMEQLRALCEDILAVRSDDREASELKKQAEGMIYRIKNPTVAPPPPDTPWLEVQERYKSGDASGALSLAQACAAKHAQCRGLEANIKEFEAKSKRLEDLGEAELYGLYELDRRIGGGGSSDNSRPLRTQLVSKLFVKASKAKTTGNWPTAIELSRKVLQADPGHVGAQALINEGRNQAKDVYLRGYQLKDSTPDEAIRLFKDVINMTPPDDELNGKAKMRIKELEHQ